MFQSSSPVAGGCDRGRDLAQSAEDRVSILIPRCRGMRQSRSSDARPLGPVSILIPRCRGMRPAPVTTSPESNAMEVSILIPRCRGIRRPWPPRCRSRRCGFNPHPPLPGDATGAVRRLAGRVRRVSILIPRCRGMRLLKVRGDNAKIVGFQSSSPVAGGCDASSAGTSSTSTSGFQSSSPVAGGCDAAHDVRHARRDRVVSILIPRCRGMRHSRLVSLTTNLTGFNPHPPLPGDATPRCARRGHAP